MSQQHSSNRIGRIVLHVGKHKTGTSSIQASLFGLDADGVRYAGLKTPNHSRVMKILFAPDRYAADNERVRRRPPEEVARLRAAARKALDATLEQPCRTLIISAEVLENLRGEEVETLIDFLRGHTDRIDVIGMVRAPIATQLSSFAQSVKRGHGDTLLDAVQYRGSFEFYMKLLGRDAVTIVPFDPPSFHNGSLVATFLRAIGEPDIPCVEKRTNESMSGDAVRLLYMLNRDDSFPLAGRQNYAARKKLRRVLANRITGAKLGLPDACHFSPNVAAEVEWLRDAAGIDFSADLARMTDNPETAAAALGEAMADISTEGIARLRKVVAQRTGKPSPEGPLDALRQLYSSYGGCSWVQ